MKKNFSKALAGTLTVAMVLGMAAPAAGTTAQAYAKNGIKTKYSAIYAGKTKTYTLKTAKKNTKWSVTGEGKQYVTLSAKKGKSVKATIAKDAPAGIKATVVAKLKKGKKYKKVDADKFTIKVDATAVAVEGNGDVKTGSTATYTAKTTPTKTTNHVYFTVTDKNGNATTGATMNATSGVLTANAAGEYKVNVATARGDKKAAEGKFTANASMDVKVTDPVAPEAKLTSAKQTEAKKIVVTFDSEVKELKNEDITIVNDSDKSSKTLKSVSIGEDKKTATIEALVDIMDGKSYTVTYKGSTAQFTATDGTVADFSLNTNEFQVKKKQELKVNVLDKNQVIIKTIDVKDTSTTDGNYTINVTSNDGYFSDDKLVMQTVGKTEEVTATYHSQKFNSTTGAEEGNVEKKFTITAIAQADLASKYEKATISDAAPDDWDETTCSLQLPINEENKKYLFAKINDVKGVETINGKVYDADTNITCTSSDDTILLVNASDDNVELTGVKAGTAYVQVKQNGVTKFTIPVTVVASRTLTNAVLDGATATVSNSSWVDDNKTVKLDTHKDQYNDDVAEKDFIMDKIELKSFPKAGESYGKSLEGSTGGTEFKFISKKAAAGTYKYEITFKDTLTDKTLKRTQTITVKEPNYGVKPTIKIKMDDNKDVAVKKQADVKTDYIDVKLGLYYDGVLGAYVDVPSTGSDDTLTPSDVKLTKNGTIEKDKFVTPGGINEPEKVIVSNGAYKFCYKFEKSGGNGTYADKLGTGNYAFKINAKAVATSAATVMEECANAADKTVPSGINDITKELTKTITIKDTQPSLVINQVKNNVDAGGAVDAIYKAVTFKYDGKTYKKADEDAKKGISIECGTQGGSGVAAKDVNYYKNGKVYNIVKMNVYVELEDADGKVSSNFNKGVKFEKKPNFSITVND